MAKEITPSTDSDDELSSPAAAADETSKDKTPKAKPAKARPAKRKTKTPKDRTVTDAIVAAGGALPIEEVQEPAEPAHFEDWGLAPTLMRALNDMGYDRPMPVQEAVYTTLAGGDDLMVQSKTGSGKTSGFGIPIAQMLSDGKKGVQALILAPTRELALQVAKEIQKLVIHMDVAVVPIYGGAPIGPQIKKLEDGGQIVAGTPGRVLDHIRRGTMDTSGIRMLVLDECDEMLSMGFQEEIENIVATLPAKEERQTMLFSATIPKEIERIGRRHMREPKMISLSSDSVGAELIDHYYYVVSGMARNRDLLKLMKSEKPESAIIFCNTRDETNTVARYLRKHGYDAEALSSDLSQADRERVMGRMREKNLNFLVATDIAARGIDISELSHVINYTFPASPEIYVHRSGRTGRAGKEGTALSLVGPREIGAFYYLKLIYKIIPTERDLPNADEMAAIEEGELYEQVIAMLQGDARKEHIALARRLWQSNEGERVVALLLGQLLSKKTEDKKQKKSTARAAAPAPVAAPETRAPIVAGPSADAQEEAPPRRKRRRRRGGPDEVGETASASVATEVAAEVAEVAIEAAETTEVAPEAVEAAATEEAATTTEEKPRRKRRRRRSETEASAEAEAETPPAATAKESAPEEEPAAEPLVAEASAPAEEARAEDAEERPRRRRTRRGRSAEASEEGSTAEASAPEATAEAADDEDVGDTQEMKVRAPAAKPKKAASKATKGRKRKPRTDAGAHVEFWEAWADSKGDEEAPAKSSASAETADASSPEEDDAKPAKRRRRRRRGSQDSEEESTSAAESTGDSAERGEQAAGDDAEENAPSSVRLFVNVGKREDADVDAIRSFLGEALGESAEGLGRITLRNTHCYIRVPEELADEVIDTCTGLVFQERDVVVERARAKR